MTIFKIFVLQAFIILTYSTISMKWQDQNGSTHTYLDTVTLNNILIYHSQRPTQLVLKTLLRDMGHF